VSRFRRKRRSDVDEGEELDEQYDDADADENDDEAGDDGAAPKRSGPWDESEVDDPASGGRINLGGMWLPGSPGLELRVEADQNTGTVIAVTMVLDDGALQLQPFAAPRSEGIWDEVRGEIRAGITAQGGTADEVEGPFGTELRTKVPVRGQTGSSVQPARFLGVDGPRWFLRGVLTGRPAVETGADAALLGLFRDVVVVRGAAPMAPREAIPLTLPEDKQALEEATAVEDDPLNPFARGPEITEIR
jgi:hypothetical protein